MYGLFAVTTAITALVLLMRPVLNDLAHSEPLNVMNEYKFITYFTLFIISLIAAPILFFACIIPSTNQKFRDSLAKSLRS